MHFYHLIIIFVKGVYLLFLGRVLCYQQICPQVYAQLVFLRFSGTDMKIFFLRAKKFLLLSFCAGVIFPFPTVAQESPNLLQKISYERKLGLARSFVAKMKADYVKSEAFLAQTIYKEYIDDNILPDGELLLLQPILPENMRLEGAIMGQVKNHKILVSLTDFANVLGLNIKIDSEKQIASGWYIRKEKSFLVDVKNKYAQTDLGRFDIGDDVVLMENDILVPIIDLGEWIDFKFRPVVSSQELKIVPSHTLPLQDRLQRRKLNYASHQVPPASLPLKESSHIKFGFPSVNVTANTVYKRDGGVQDAIKKADVNIRTTGDFANGTLKTQASINDEDRLRNLRVNYAQQSDKPELLGVLKARKFEVGDVTTVNSDIGSQISQELGVRVTNADPLKTYSKSTTAISGYAFSGWDVELYRDSQLLSFKEVDENGYYNFENVNLFASDNNFKLKFYGPQGEEHEENLFIPIDQTRLSNSQGAYDVSITFDGKQFYRKKGTLAEDEDEGSPSLMATYEYPVFDSSAVSAGVRSNEQNGERNNVASAGLSTTLKGVLLNADVAVDDEGDAAAELTARRSIGQHDVNNVLSWTAPHFDTKEGGDMNALGEVSNSLRLIGPLPTPEFMTRKMRYSTNLTYRLDSEGEGAISAVAGVSAAVKNVSLNQQVSYQDSDSEAQARLNLYSVASANYGKNHFRLQSNYQVKPDSQLMSVLANYRRRLSNVTEFSLEVDKQYLNALTEFSAKLDWQAGFARISPRVTYNTEKDLYVGLTTRFGLLKDPRGQSYSFYGKNVSATGGASIFVFLDSNGNGAFDEGEEKLEDVVVLSPQNGGRERTDKNGVALFTRMQELVRTDVYLDIDSLKDPTWVPGFKGVSIKPRNGYYATIDFPVHISGELDGTIYMGQKPVSVISPVETEELGNVPLRNITVALYNFEGEVEQSTVTDEGGFYYFSRIPPGRYFLIIDEKNAQDGKFIRPLPQEVEIGYDGTVIYGRDLFVQGGNDVPSEIFAQNDDYKSLYPDVDFAQDYEFVLNFGEYNSQLLSSVVWYKMRTRYAPILAGADIFVPPSRSIPMTSEGKYILRVGLQNSSLEDAYKRCRSMIARNQFCKVELYPKYMKQAVLTQQDHQPISLVSDALALE